MKKEMTDKLVAEFINYFGNQIELVSTMRTKADRRHTDLYKQILYAAILDSMSRTVFPNKGNRERFVAFLEKYSGWSEGNHVSLPHLVQLLGKAPDPIFEKIRQFANLELDKWSPGEIVTLNRDPSFKVASRLWPSDNQHRFAIGKVELESIQHWHLAYTYRNTLVHEFRSLGHGIEVWDKGIPYYISTTERENISDGPFEGLELWELIYTAAFFRQLCTTSLKNLGEYLMANRIDPFASYDQGSYWIADLN